MILGLGVDLVDVARFEATVLRTPALLPRLFTEGEQRLPVRSLAARFAAKEALAKALGAPGSLHWHDAEVMVGEHGRPHLEVRGTVADHAAALGVTSWHLSLSHDGGIASAVVVAERAGELGVSRWHLSLSHDGGIASAVVIAEGGVAQGRQNP